jgi:surface antigen
MSQVFVRRTTAPSQTNKYYIKTTYGGYNRCILINSETGSVLPNCVGYAWGRFCEEQNIHDCKLSRGNAENWYGYNDGYTRGQTPKLGAVICWHSTRSGGHVAIVEKIYSNGMILTSNSAYNGSRFYKKTLHPPQYFMGSSYDFQGFIYPDIEFTDPDTPVPPVVTPKKSRFPWVLYSRKLRNNRK